MSLIILMFLVAGYFMIQLDEKGRTIQAQQKLDERRAFEERFRRTMISQAVEDQVYDLIYNHRDEAIKELGEIFSHFSNLRGHEDELRDSNVMCLNFKFVNYFLCLNRGYIPKDNERNPHPGYFRGGMRGFNILWDDATNQSLKKWVESKFLQRGYRITYGNMRQFDSNLYWYEY